MTIEKRSHNAENLSKMLKRIREDAHALEDYGEKMLPHLRDAKLRDMLSDIASALQWSVMLSAEQRDAERACESNIELHRRMGWKP